MLGSCQILFFCLSPCRQADQHLYLIIGWLDREFVTPVNLSGQGRGLRRADGQATIVQNAIVACQSNEV